MMVLWHNTLQVLLYLIAFLWHSTIFPQILENVVNKFQNQCFSWYTNQYTWTEFHKYWQRELVETVKQYSHWICKTIASIAWRPNLPIVAMFQFRFQLVQTCLLVTAIRFSIFVIILFLNNWDINGCCGQNDHFSLSSFSFSFRTSIWTGSNGTEKENKILQIKFLIEIIFKNSSTCNFFLEWGTLNISLCNCLVLVISLKLDPLSPWWQDNLTGNPTKSYINRGGAFFAQTSPNRYLLRRMLSGKRAFSLPLSIHTRL